MAGFIAFITVIFIDISLSADNAVVVGMAAAGLPQRERKKAIFLGIVCAALLRIVFATFAVLLLGIVGLTLAGGLLLLWVSWKLWEELRGHAAEEQAKGPLPAPRQKTFLAAVAQILIADVSMSLDNVLAVAGAAREHLGVMVFGLVLSVALMGAGASVIASLIERHKWISYVGLLIILYVAVKMIFEGVHDVLVGF